MTFTWTKSLSWLAWLILTPPLRIKTFLHLLIMTLILCFKASVPFICRVEPGIVPYHWGQRPPLHWFQGAETPAQLASPAFLYLLTYPSPQEKELVIWFMGVGETEVHAELFVFFFKVGSACEQRVLILLSSFTLYMNPGQTPIKWGSCLGRWQGSAIFYVARVVQSFLASSPEPLSPIISAISTQSSILGKNS